MQSDVRCLDTEVERASSEAVLPHIYLAELFEAEERQNTLQCQNFFVCKTPQRYSSVRFIGFVSGLLKTRKTYDLIKCDFFFVTAETEQECLIQLDLMQIGFG